MHKCILEYGVSGYHGNRNGLNWPWVVAKRSMKRLGTDIFRPVLNRFWSALTPNMNGQQDRFKFLERSNLDCMLSEVV